MNKVPTFLSYIAFNSLLFRDHEISRMLGTPVRNHILFPGMEEREKKKTCNLLLGKAKVATSSRQNLQDIIARTTSAKGKLLNQEVAKASRSIQSGDFTEKTEKRCSGQDMSFPARSIRPEAARISLNDEKLSVYSNSNLTPGKMSSVKNDNFSSSSLLHPARPLQEKLPSTRTGKTILEKPAVKKIKISPQSANSDVEKRYYVWISYFLYFTESNEQKELNFQVQLYTFGCDCFRFLFALQNFVFDSRIYGHI